MQIYGTNYTESGRQPGSFVYLFLCEHRKIVIAKMGVSDHPLSRLPDLRATCPFNGELFATINVPTRKVAFSIEADLLKRFENFRTRGEWMCFGLEDKPTFNAELQAALVPHRRSGWPLKIVTVEGARARTSTAPMNG